jgi:hypothetical protein
MYERFTDRVRKVMQLANQEAQRLSHEYIGTEHILLGLVKEGSGVAANVLKNLDIDLRKIETRVEAIAQTGPKLETAMMGRLSHTPLVKKVIECSIEEARSLNHNYVGTEHLLLGLIREPEGLASEALQAEGLSADIIRKEILRMLGQVKAFDETPELSFDWTQANADPNSPHYLEIKRTLHIAIASITNGETPVQVSMKIDQRTAGLLSKTDEVREHIRTTYVGDQPRVNGAKYVWPNSAWGLPHFLYGLEIIIKKDKGKVDGILICAKMTNGDVKNAVIKDPFRSLSQKEESTEILHGDFLRMVSGWPHASADPRSPGFMAINNSLGYVARHFRRPTSEGILMIIGGEMTALDLSRTHEIRDYVRNYWGEKFFESTNAKYGLTDFVYGVKVVVLKSEHSFISFEDGCGSPIMIKDPFATPAKNEPKAKFNVSSVFGQMLCKTLGINPKGVTKLSIICDMAKPSVVTASVEMSAQFYEADVCQIIEQAKPHVQVNTQEAKQ